MILSTCSLSFLVASLLFGPIFWAVYCRLFSILRSYCYPCFGGLRSELCEFSEVLGDGSKCKFVAGAAWPCEPEAPAAKDAFEMCKRPLALLAPSLCFRVEISLCGQPCKITCIFMFFATDETGFCIWAAFWF